MQVPVHALEQHTPSTQESPDSHCAVAVQASPSMPRASHCPIALQNAPESQSPLLAHAIAQRDIWSGDWLIAEVHATAGYSPHALD